MQELYNSITYGNHVTIGLVDNVILALKSHYLLLDTRMVRITPEHPKTDTKNELT